MTSRALVIREIGDLDLDPIVALDRLRAGAEKREYWQRILSAYRERPSGVALVATTSEGELAGFLFGEVRAWEFGSERCGWIFAVAVSPEHERAGVATGLCEEAILRFRDLGVDVVRTMVRRDDIPVLAFFRSQGFAAGAFAELERPVALEEDE